MNDKKDDKKEDTILSKYIFPVIMLFLVGGTTPWWFKELKDQNKNLDDQNKNLVEENIRLREKLDSIAKLQSNKDGLALFNGYEVSYNLDTYTKDIAVGLILSEQTRKRIASISLEKIEAVVIFAPRQEFVNLWISDTRGIHVSKKLSKDEGKQLNPERADERFFELLISNLQPVDPLSISRISFEAKGILGVSNKFIVKQVNLK